MGGWEQLGPTRYQRRFRLHGSLCIALVAVYREDSEAEAWLLRYGPASRAQARLPTFATAAWLGSFDDDAGSALAAATTHLEHLGASFEP